jgi:predicted metal-dependent hydrolase
MPSRSRTPSWLRKLAAQPLRALLDRRQSEPQTFQIVFDRDIYLISVRRHRRARRYTLRIHSATREVILTMPTRGSVREAKAFAQKDGGENLICVAGDAPYVERRIGDFLRREAQRDLSAASRRAADMIGVSVKRISVRDQSSRWGSCSTTGVLSYSWRLILAPPFVLDYLAIHEVAHLVEMNHSPRFWRLVNRMCPDAERAKVWLDVHGADLHRYGLPAESADSRQPG